MKTVMKVLTALAAVVGVIYVVATYGDKIVAWAKNLLNACPFCKNECEVVEEDFEPVTPAAPAAEETPAAAEDPEVEVEIVVESNEPVAEETDFEA